EIRTTADGTKVAGFLIATNRSWTDREGQQQERTEWHRIVAWASLADVTERYLKKGVSGVPRGRDPVPLVRGSRGGDEVRHPDSGSRAGDAQKQWESRCRKRDSTSGGRSGGIKLRHRRCYRAVGRRPSVLIGPATRLCGRMSTETARPRQEKPPGSLLGLTLTAAA